MEFRFHKGTESRFNGATFEDAQWQYRLDPDEAICALKTRALVHFRVDNQSLITTTPLAGSAARFLAFDRGSGDGNPPDIADRTCRTAYLCEEAVRRDSLPDLLARFDHTQIQEKRGDRGRKSRGKTMIFHSRRRSDQHRSAERFAALTRTAARNWAHAIQICPP